MKSSRLFSILYRLLHSDQLTAPVLARELEVSVRTIYRDIEALCEAGIPITVTQGKGGGIRLMDGFVMNRALMSAKEQEELLLAVQSLQAASQEDISSLLHKLGALFCTRSTGWLRVDFNAWGPVQERNERFETIKTAILQKRILEFEYAGIEGTAFRRVKPVLLCFKGSAWYLQAFCLLRSSYRTFKLSRVTRLALTGETFAEELSPPPLDPWNELCEWPMVELRFRACAAYRVYDDFDPETIQRQADGSLLVRAPMPCDDAFRIARLLPYGKEVDILSPAELKRTLAAYTLELAEFYRRNS